MKWKKLMTVLIVAVFVISSIAVLANTASGEPKYVDNIRFEVRTSESTGIGDTATGDLDVFVQSVSGKTYEGMPDDWKSKLGTWKSAGGYNNQYLNPVHNKEHDVPVVPVSGQLEFNPFGNRKVRFAVNHLMNRKHIVEDMYNGYANPRYTPLGVDSPGYSQYFDPIIKEELGISYSGDFQKGYDLVQEGMEEAQQKLETLNNDPDISRNFGELQIKNGADSDPGKNNKWQYKNPGGSFSNVEIISLNRIEDTRLQIGHYFTDQMEKVGFDTVDNDLARSKALGISFYSDPANLDWHSYTGGWLSSTALKFQEVAVNQMYAPWYSYMPGALAGGQAWKYENETLDDIGKPLQNGEVADNEEYWDMMQDMMRIGVKESVRVFLASTIDFYVYDKDRVDSAATDVVTGWSSLFGPRTMQIDTNSDTAQAKLGQYSSTGALYMDNWNRIGGSSDTYSQAQQDVVRDWATYLNPSSGTSIPMRTDWDLQRNFEWNDTDGDGEKEKQKNLDVPDTALKYDTVNNEWKEIGSGQKSAIAVTYDWNFTGNGMGTWHDGHEITERDILAWYAFSKELSYDDGGDYYFGPHASVSKPWYDSITGVEWGEEDGTYTVYGNYTFPAETKMGSYYTSTPMKPWQINEAAQQMIEGSDQAASSSESWGWSDAAENWIHFISSEQSDKFMTTMDNMVSNDWTPEYLKAANNCPLPITDAEMSANIDDIKTFYNDYNHLFDSQGPFKITTVDESNMLIDMERHTTGDGYPLADDYWSSTLQNIEFAVGTPNIPSYKQLGKDIDVEINQCRVIETYPTQSERLADTGTVTFQLSKGGVAYGDPIEGTLTTSGTFIATIPGSVTENLPAGTYTISIQGEVEGSLPDSTSETILLAPGQQNPQVEQLEVTPSSGKMPLDIFIEAQMRNPSGDTATIPVNVGGTQIDSYTLADGEQRDVLIKHTIDQIGTHTVDVGDSADGINGTSTTVDVNDDPGISVSNLDVSVTGMNLTITADVENTASQDMDAMVKVGPKMESMQEVHTETISAGNTIQISTTHEVNDNGDYKVMVGNAGNIASVTGGGPVFEMTQAMEVSEDGLKITVTATVENTGDGPGTVNIWADDTKIGSASIGAGESKDIEVTHEFDSEGQYAITMGETQDDPIEEGSADVSEDGGDGTPGFTFALLAISAVAAVIVYKKKNR